MKKNIVVLVPILLILLSFVTFPQGIEIERIATIENELYSYNVAISPNGGYVLVGDERQTIFTFAKSDGTILWRYTLPEDNEVESGAISTNGNLVVIGGQGGILFAFAKDGTLLWDKYVGWECQVAMNETGDKIIAASAWSGDLYCFDENGHQIWKREINRRDWNIWGISISSDGSKILLRTNSDIILCDGNGNEIFFYDVVEGNHLWGACLSPNGNQFVVAYRGVDENFYVSLYNVYTGEIWSKNFHWWVADAAIDDYGRIFMTGNRLGIADTNSNLLAEYYSGGINIQVSKNGEEVIVGDFSEAAVYKITGLATINSIRVASPNGGQTFSVGKSEYITWTSTGSINNVRIEYSTDSGTNWSTIVSSTANDGVYSWPVPDTPSSSCLIKISEVSDADLSDKSDSVFTIDSSPLISVNRSRLIFGYLIGSNIQPVETFTISNSGTGTLNWNVSCEMNGVSLNPESGIDSESVEVTIDPVGLPTGNSNGVIYISDPLAFNSPVAVEISLRVKAQSESSPPFGEFSTPVDRSTVSSSIPVTGWVLGDTGIENVKIYREQDSSLVYIGDAIFVEGARQDIEEAYPDYPMNYKAGWGYMMLTNFLPNGGNGTFKIHAVATDKEGRTNTLGVKTITFDNANAVKPFGAIDTPVQGGTASGSNYRNQGWVLTPLPNKITEDGSTINVYVDGVNLGHPLYNVYREDIAGYFPGYNNSDGAHAYFDFDTTAYANGVHTIYWTATDNAGNTDGIGSRYFSILNSQGARSLAQSAESIAHSAWRTAQSAACLQPVGIIKGYARDVEPQMLYPDDNGTINIEIKELERLEIHLSDLNSSSFITPYSSFYAGYSGYQLVGDQFKPLPIGSFLDMEKGIFYWQPGPGFVGEYEFIFIIEERKVRIKVRILPKFSK